MIEPRWIVQAAAWLLSFLSLLLAYQFIERRLIARFQQRAVLSPVPKPASKNNKAAMLFLVALLAGAAIPLAPEITIGGWQIEFHLFGHSGIALLYTLVMQWVGDGLATWPGTPQRSMTAWQGFVVLYFNALPMLLIVLCLLLSGGQNNLYLTAWIEAQDGWNGLKWTAWTQPLLLVLWLICARPPRPDARMQATWAYKALALNRALLAGALFLGGWQGPLVDHFPWLGLLYTAAKAGGVMLIWTWLRATLPHPTPGAHTRTMWRVWTPLALFNLIVTALLVLIR